MENDIEIASLDPVADTFTTGLGSEMQTDYFVWMSSPPFAYIRVLDKTFVECATIFSNPEEVKEITHGPDVLTGYSP